MLQIKEKIYNSRDFLPSYASETDDYIKNDKKIASDNIQVKPLSISSVIFYKVKTGNENKNESIKFIEDIIDNQELITVVDLDNMVEYNDLHIATFNIKKIYKEGFLADISFKYVPVTETAVNGKEVYKGYSSRNSRILQKPLKKVKVEVGNLPPRTIRSILKNGDATWDDVLNFENIPEGSYLDELDLTDPEVIALNKVLEIDTLDFEAVTEAGASQLIQTNVSGFNGVFDLASDGTFDILDSMGEAVSMGQKLLVDVELLANTIPGVDISLKLLPITQMAGSSVFDMSRLGKDFIVNVGNVNNSIFDILGD